MYGYEFDFLIFLIPSLREIQFFYRCCRIALNNLRDGKDLLDFLINSPSLFHPPLSIVAHTTQTHRMRENWIFSWNKHLKYLPSMPEVPFNLPLKFFFFLYRFRNFLFVFFSFSPSYLIIHPLVRNWWWIILICRKYFSSSNTT